MKLTIVEQRIIDTHWCIFVSFRRDAPDNEQEGSSCQPIKQTGPD